MMCKSGRGTVGPTPQRIISMSLTEVSLGKLLASRAHLCFARRRQLTKRNAAAPQCRQFPKYHRSISEPQEPYRM